MSVGVWEETGSCALCVCGGLRMESFCAYTHCAVFTLTYFPVQTHVPLHCVLLNVTGVPRTTCPFMLQIMSILICTYLDRLMPAWHSNFTAQSQVEAVSAAPIGRDFSLSDEERQNVALNYWTDTWLTGRLMKMKGKETEREERTKIGIVKLIDTKDNFRWGVDIWKKNTDKIWLQGLWWSGQNCWNCSLVLYFSIPKSEKVIPGNPSERETLNLTHDAHLTVELITFVSYTAAPGKTNCVPEADRV